MDNYDSVTQQWASLLEPWNVQLKRQPFMLSGIRFRCVMLFVGQLTRSEPDGDVLPNVSSEESSDEASGAESEALDDFDLDVSCAFCGFVYCLNSF